MLESLNYLLDPILNPLLALGPLWTIIIVSVFVSFIIVLATKFFTDQKLMKALKDEMKVMQKDIKNLQGDQQKFAEQQKKLMEKNWQYMKQSFKPTLITWLPLIIILGWVSLNLAYFPLPTNEYFTVNLEFAEGADGNVMLDSDGLLVNEKIEKEIIDGKVGWSLMAEKEGIYILKFKHNDKEYDKKIIISQNDYEQPVELLKESELKKIEVGNRPMRFFGSFHLFGWYPGWLATYIVISLAISMLIRKLFKVH